MAELERVDQLEAPPVVGKVYLVPALETTWAGSPGVWPVRGVPHTENDRDDVIDWHVDRRFFTAEQDEHAEWVEFIDQERFDRVAPVDPGGGRRWPGSRASGQFNLVWSGADDVQSPLFHLKPGRPGEARIVPLECRHPTVVPEPLLYPVPWPRWGFTGGIAEARYDGRRPLCPHHGTDLTGEPIDPDGFVVCPFHRLRVRCERRRA